jgi:hypothetical protein
MKKTQQEALAVFTGTFMQRILNQQDKLKAIWEDALKTSPKRELMVVAERDQDGNVIEIVEQACFRRGYKVTLTEKTGLYELLRTNTSDYYKHTTNAEIELFRRKGWIRACDEQQVIRDKKRLAKFNKKIDNANEQRNDSLMTHWRKRRMELIDNISTLEEKLNR